MADTASAVLNDIVDKMTSGDGPYALSAVTEQIVENYPLEVGRYLIESQHAIVSQYVRLRLSSKRTQAINRAKNDAVIAVAEGRKTDRTLMDVQFVVNELLERKKLQEMDHAEALFAAQMYYDQSEDAANYGRVLTAIAKNLGPNQIVADVFTEEQLVSLVKLQFGDG